MAVTDDVETQSGGIVWRPAEEYLRTSRLKRFMNREGVADYEELLRRSTDDLDWFWRAACRDLELEWYRPFEQVVDTSRGIPWARWWLGGRLNYVHNALDKHALSDRRERPALVWEGEDGAVRTYSYAELWAETNRLANALRTLGIGKGDRVGIFMPM